MPAGDYGNLRYSTLDTIKTTNVMNLRVLTTFSTGIPHGHEGQPLVFGNTMYVVTPFPNNLIAGMFSFAAREYFEADQGANEVPKVKF